MEDKELELFKAQMQLELEKNRNSLARDLENHRAQLQGNHEAWKIGQDRKSQWAIASFQAIVGFANAGIRGLVLINGGAAIAILTFLGSIWTADRGDAHRLANPPVPGLACFMTGVGCAVAVALFSYLSQSCYSLDHSPKHQKWGNIFRYIAIAVGIFSFAAFSAGCLLSIDAFGFSLAQPYR